ncbi:hypothetical protein BAZSYMA_ACONTIG220918_0 [Bathymodiolus azoricus thioautotrophic gill symbiont]|uniref:Uncharacterized protein n=1 Tax=Bathymodiolus azoricus thioautotrophic gill symbiont TaxID=235205 RepID=A0A1H6MP82_9GAMM|nr:hypothetical protein BAZSYMA_ACONTIG220918_0 [Bathymodiolus azoricus thioautotrophic gill symbiont]
MYHNLFNLKILFLKLFFFVKNLTFKQFIVVKYIYL